MEDTLNRFLMSFIKIKIILRNYRDCENNI